MLTLPVGRAHTPLWQPGTATGGPRTYLGSLDLQPIPPQSPLLPVHRFHSHTPARCYLKASSCFPPLFPSPGQSSLQ